MTNPESPIIDFYPENFEIDMNGKKQAWLGVALLPFVDEERLLSALAPCAENLLPEEKLRNQRGNEYLFLGKEHPFFDSVNSLYSEVLPWHIFFLFFFSFFFLSSFFFLFLLDSFFF